MKARLLTALVGVNFALTIGDTIEGDDADRMVRAGLAEPVDTPADKSVDKPRSKAKRTA